MSRNYGAKAPVEGIALHFESTSISIRNRVTADFVLIQMSLSPVHLTSACSRSAGHAM